MLCAVRPEMKDLTNDSRKMYKNIQNETVKIKALMDICDSLRAEKQQMDMQNNALILAHDRLTAQAEKIFLHSQCVPNLAPEAHKLRADVTCLTSELAAKNSSTECRVCENTTVTKLENVLLGI